MWAVIRSASNPLRRSCRGDASCCFSCCFGILIDFAHEWSGGCGNCNLAAQYFVAIHIVAIHGSFSALAGLHYGAIECDSGENALERQYDESPQ